MKGWVTCVLIKRAEDSSAFTLDSVQLAARVVPIDDVWAGAPNMKEHAQ